MNTILKSSIIAATLAFGTATFFSAGPAAADGFSFETGLSILEKTGMLNTGNMLMKKRMHPRVNMPMQDEGPSYGMLEGGARLMIVINPKRTGPAVVHGKNNCDHIKLQIAAGEKRLAQMNAHLDQMLADYQVKKIASTKDDTYYTGLAIASLDDQIKDLEKVLANLRGKLKKCEAAKWF